MFITHINALLVLIFAIYFRLSITMLIFIILYMIYYWKLNNTLFERIEREKFIYMTFEKIIQFKK